MTNEEAKAIAEGHRKREAWNELAPLFAHLRDRMSERLFSSSIEQDRLREKMFLAVQTLDAVQRVVEQTIKGAEQAQLISDHFDQLRVMDDAIAQEGLTRP